jgi:hemerythrin-like domain-containing protein
MDPVKLVKQDHRTVKALFRRFDTSSKRADRQKLGEEIIEELSVHTAIEEQLLYPALRARTEALVPIVLNLLEEHHAAKLLLAELDAMKADEERYAAKMHVVQESVEQHIEQEEHEVLPRLGELFEPDELEAMGDAMLAMKALAPNHPHPDAPDTPEDGMFAAMLAKLSDTGKDLVRKLMDSDSAEGHREVKRRARTTIAAQAKRSRRGARPGRGAAAH